MIKTEHLSKAFGEIKAVDNIGIEITDNSIFGLAGTNGAGKSTFLRLLSGVLKPDQGSILIDEKPVYEQEEIKREIFFCRTVLILFQMQQGDPWLTGTVPIIRSLTKSGLMSFQKDWTWIPKGRYIRSPKE